MWRFLLSLIYASALFGWLEPLPTVTAVKKTSELFLMILSFAKIVSWVLSKLEFGSSSILTTISPLSLSFIKVFGMYFTVKRLREHIAIVVMIIFFGLLIE